MFALVITAVTLFHMHVASTVEGTAAVHEREYCPFPTDGPPGVNVAKSTLVSADITCQSNGSVAVSYTIIDHDGDDYVHEELDQIHMELVCYTEVDGHVEEFENQLLGMAILVRDTTVLHRDVCFQGATCYVYGCFTTQPDYDVHEFRNVSCSIPPPDPMSMSTTDDQHECRPFWLRPNSGEETVQPTTTTAGDYFSTFPPPKGLTTSMIRNTSVTMAVTDSVTVQSTHTPIASPSPTTKVQAFVTTAPAQSEMHQPPPTTEPTTPHSAVITSTMDSNKVLSISTTPVSSPTPAMGTRNTGHMPDNKTTIITAAVFVSLILSCFIVTLLLTLTVGYRRRQRRMNKYHLGYQYDVTVDPNFNPVDVHSTNVRLTQSLHSVFDALKASTLTLRQHGPEEAGSATDDDKSEILQSQNDESMSGRSVLLSDPEHESYVSTNLAEESNHGTAHLPNENNETCRVNPPSVGYQQTPTPVISPSGVGYVHASEQDKTLKCRSSSESSSYVYALTPTESSPTSHIHGVSIPLKTFTHPRFMDGYLRDSSDISDSSFSTGLTSIATSSSGYVTDVPGSESAYEGLSEFSPKNIDENGYLPSLEDDITQISSTNPLFSHSVQDHNSDSELECSNSDNLSKMLPVKHSQYGTGYVTAPDEHCAHDSQVYSCKDSDYTLQSVVLDDIDSLDILYSSEPEDTMMDVSGSKCGVTEWKRNINTVDSSSECSLSLNPMHFQPIDSDSDFCDNY